MVPKVLNSDLLKAQQQLDSIKVIIEKEQMTIANAALKYSDDAETRYNSGAIINQQSGTTKFETAEMEAGLFFNVDKLKIGEYSAPLKFTTNDGKPAYRILYLKSRTAPHKANLKEDYQRLQNVALVKKQHKAIEAWINKKKATTYFRIDKSFADCNFRHDWFNNTSAKKNN
jgi:peptidyl-prolyl cis-trans isomerase SurA